jgi:menaquinone-dependent protoporphyrinogen oxidase
MVHRILLAFATKHGSTADVAGVVAAELREAGLYVEVAEICAVRDLTGFDAVVVGAPLYVGRWHRDARVFLRRFSGALGSRPLAIFALGPLKEDGSDVAGAQRQLNAALAESPVRAADAVLFGGALDPALLHFPLDRMPKADVRDWVRIRAWARGLPELFDRVATLTRDVSALS